jgi:hypothetical protein
MYVLLPRQMEWGRGRPVAGCNYDADDDAADDGDDDNYNCRAMGLRDYCPSPVEDNLMAAQNPFLSITRMGGITRTMG